ncbi:MAG TPA: hypothetical protein VKF38_04550 [Anaerolineaceae bacterium]|nr:hypothetical protein [Anaerolineaceae bacterium]
MRTLKIRNWEVPVVLFWVSLLAFGILIPWLGFYADDWPYLYTVKAFGPQGLNDFISWVRPFSAWVLLAVLIAFSAGLIFQNANLYRKEFTTLKQFYWELSWRAPGLEKGTAEVIEESPFNYHVDTSLTPLLNWTYDPLSSSTNLPYAVLEYHKIASKYASELENNIPIHQHFFNYDFNGSNCSLLFVAFDPPGCVRMLTPQEKDQMLMLAGFKQELNLSNSGLILNDGNYSAQPPVVLGTNSIHDWCYYFEKADLAAQEGNWKEVVMMGQTALRASLKPQYPSELVVFIEGFAHTGDWSQAHEFAKTMLKDPFFKSTVCDTWSNLEQDMSTIPDNMKILSGYKKEFGCNS